MRKWLILLLVLIVAACQGTGQQAQQHNKTQSQSKHKKVVMVIFDSMTKELVDQAIEEDKAPALRFLIDHGQYYREGVAPFPSMSVTVESSILTGTHPDEHGVAGLAWYSPKEERVVNYGSAILTWAHRGVPEGIGEGVYDALEKLNQEHLNQNTPTIFEELERYNRSGGAINTLVYRGMHSHSVSLPYGLERMLRLPDKWKVNGPKLFSLGRFSKSKELRQANLSDDLFSRFGLTDDYSVTAFQEVVKAGQQPDFLMVFLPDFDKITHEEGPQFMEGFLEVEQRIQRMLDSYGSWTKALEENIFIVLGDHGQSRIKEKDGEAVIDLYHVFAGYTISPLDQPKQGDIVVAVNQRMSYVYDVHQQGILPALIEMVKSEERIGVIGWKEDDWYYVHSPKERKQLRFKKDGEWTDSYGQAWHIEGNPQALDLTLSHEKKEISFGDYPDSLQHVYSALSNQEVPTMILSADSGYSFYSEGIPTHPGGGDHGGLHKDDVQSAMIISGTDRSLESARLVDLKEYVISLLTKPENIVQEKKFVPKGKKANLARKLKPFILSVEGVDDCVVVALDDHIYIGIQASNFQRFRLKQLRQETYRLASSMYDPYKVHVSSDWKVNRELNRVSKEQEKMSEEKLRKKLEHIEKSMKG